MADSNRDPVSNQLKDWEEQHQDKQECAITISNGNLVQNQETTISIGPNGPLTLYDNEYFDLIAHFNRERVPERVVHAKGGGAYGYFKCTADISNLTNAKVFHKNKKTTIVVRFSRNMTNLGSSDTVRDVRGFSIKFNTEDGTWDLVGNNTPTFFMRDPKLFPMFVHSQKPNPVTFTRDWDMYWDFLSLNEQSTHQVLFLFSDRGIPDGYRHMNGYGSHTFSLINNENKLTYVKFHFLTNQGIKNLSESEATKIAGEDPDYANRDLYNSIANNEEPSWTFYIQTMNPEDVKNLSFNPFDITKTWPHEDYPLIKIGELVLNRNPSNYFAEIEQLAFNPSNIVPGIGLSPDRLLQGRLFAYSDTQRYRIGANYYQLPINMGSNKIYCNYLRDGSSTINNQGGAPNYYPNSFGGPETMSYNGDWLKAGVSIRGKLGYFDLDDLDNYTQPKIFVTKILNKEKLNILIENLANSLKKASKKIQTRALKNFEKVDTAFAHDIKLKLESTKQANL